MKTEQPYHPTFKILTQYILNRIKKNKNFLGIVCGPTGSGKSWSAIALCEYLDKEFDVTHINFRSSEFVKKVTQLKKLGKNKGSCLMIDEAGTMVGSRQWQSKNNQALTQLLQIFRNMNFIVFFCVPHFKFVDSQARNLFHGLFETQGVGRLKFLRLQSNPKSGKIYTHYLRANTGTGMADVATIKIPKPSDDMIETYEKKKWAFTSAMAKEILAGLKAIEEKDKAITSAKKLKCLVCNYQWIPRNPKLIPGKCAKCSSSNWEKPIELVPLAV